MSETPATPQVLEAASGWCLKFAAGSLSTEDQQRFEQWIDTHPEHRRAFEDAVGVWRATAEVAAAPTLLALRREALESFERANRAKWAPKVAWWQLGLGWKGKIAATVLLSVGVLGFWLYWAPSAYRTGIGERRVVVLADGSKVSLDAQTTVGVRYTEHSRALKLERGRAKFDVAKNAGRPFTVAVADKTVLATGTAFSVELLKDKVEIILYEGHVQVLSEHPGSRPEPVRIRELPRTGGSAPLIGADPELIAGHELIVPVAASDAEIVAADPVRSLAWEGGQLVFMDEPLASAVQRVNRYSNRKLILGDERVGKIRINGVFSAGEADAFVEGITAVFPIRAHETSSGVALITRP
jgi:transmembrane sensor